MQVNFRLKNRARTARMFIVLMGLSVISPVSWVNGQLSPPPDDKGIKSDTVGILHLPAAGRQIPPLYINEFVKSHQLSAAESLETGEVTGWIEILNAGPESIDLSGMFLTDDFLHPDRWKIPAGTWIAPGAHLVFIADGRPEEGPNHTAFKLSPLDSELGLFAFNGETYEQVDAVRIGDISPYFCYGRSPYQRNQWTIQHCPSPGDQNQSAGDLNCDGLVDFQDLGPLLSDWPTHTIDLNGDTWTDNLDLSMLIRSWGWETPSESGPDIRFLRVDPPTIATGETVEVCWQAVGADTVVLKGLGTVPAEGKLMISPRQDTLIALEATSQQGAVESEAIVKVLPDLAIDFFIADPPVIAPGHSSKLSWQVTDSDFVQIEGVGKVQPVGSLYVSPSQSREFSLIAEKGGDELEAAVSVTVDYPTEIIYFKADPSVVQYGKSVRLSWDTRYAETVILEGLGEVLSPGSQTFTPEQDTTYRLEARHDQRIATAEIVVTVVRPNRPPVAWAGYDRYGGTTGVYPLDGTGSFDPDGDDLEYFWKQISGPPVEIENAGSMVTSFVATTSGTFLFTLVVTDEHGLTDYDHVKITVF